MEVEMESTKACVFDAYGTLLDVAAAAREVLAPIDSSLAAHVAADWRHKQLQYTWILSMSGHYEDFWSVTGASLDWALARHRIDDKALRQRLLDVSMTLQPYPEVKPLFNQLEPLPLKRAILSNGTPAMLAAAVASAGIADQLDDVFSVDSIGIYKPDPRVYALVTEAYAITPADVVFVSANGWDAAGASSFGFQTVWVNRADEPVDRLPHRPGTIIPDLRTLAEILATS